MPACPPARTVGLVVHGGRSAALDAAHDTAVRFAAAGAKVVSVEGDGLRAEGVEVRAAEVFPTGLDLVVVLGGDGTFLRAAYLARDHGLALLGVNLGRLGFLSEVETDGIDTLVTRTTAGDYEVEERMTLTVQVLDAEGRCQRTSWALNEAAVKQMVPQRLIVHEVAIGRGVFANIAADAIICATPTGSTAYAFSARGPVVSPVVDALLIVPVAPHALFDRTVVVDPAEAVRLTPSADSDCVVTLDGREHLPVPPGGSVRVHRGEAPVRMARLEPFDFYGRVRRKFGLP